MRFLITIIASLVLTGYSLAQPVNKEFFVFFETQLVCGAKETIGCGSRAKPLLLDFEASEIASEAWLNREGTIVAIVLKKPYLPIRQLLQKAKAIFDRHDLTWKPIQGGPRYQELAADLRKQGRWYRGAAVDSLSWEEAAWITEGALQYLDGFEKMRQDSATALRQQIASFVGRSLTSGEALSQTDMSWGIIQIASNFVSTAVLNRSLDRYRLDHEGGDSYLSTITCPKCGHRSTEVLHADRCIMEYTCKNCHAPIHHKVGDCCVFCSYGDVKCLTAEE